jgi:diacylglycerol O-acyltransferase
MAERSQNVRLGVLSVRVDELKQAAHAAGCKLNDAFLAALAGGWRLYHEYHGVRQNTLQLSFPINLRTDGASEGGAGNQVSVGRDLIAINEKDPVVRMRTCRDMVARERAAPASQHMDLAAAAMNAVPPALFGPFASWAARSNDFIASCVPGLPVPLYLAGSRIDALYTFGPLAGAAANITLFSYRDVAYIALTVDPAAIPDQDVLLACMRRGFGEVIETG